MAYDTITQILGENDGTALVADINGFSRIAEGRDPAEVGLYLTGFYIHVTEVVKARGGRVVKFLGDGVLAAFFGADHREKAIGALADFARGHEAWLSSAKRAGMPPLDFAAAVASGHMLEGDIGTDHVTFYDVIGAPVNLAFRLCAIAGSRGAMHLVDESTAAVAGREGVSTLVEVDGAEVVGAGRRKLLAIAGADAR